MCGIFAYNGKNGNVAERILKGVELNLERGYDSIGVALDSGSEIKLFKKAFCEIVDIKHMIEDDSQGFNDASYVRGIGHNRWATIGEVFDKNAHPHWDYSEKFIIAQNGNVENYHDLKDELVSHYKLSSPITFLSETDTELIANLISLEYDGDLEKTIMRVMRRLKGANAIVVMSLEHADVIYGAKIGSPLLVCKNDDGVMLSSSAYAFMDPNSHAIPEYQVLDDAEVVSITNNSFTIKKKGVVIDKETLKLDKHDLEIGLGKFKHFMQKEIIEQPRVLANTISGRMIKELGISKLGGIEEHAEQISRVKTFHFIGCGTAYNACVYAKTLFNRFGIAANAWVASEFCDCHPVYDATDAFIFVSQSGETADTIEVLKEIKDIKRKLCIGIVNRQETEIPRKTHAGIHIRAGIERGVASTKAYTSQLASIALLAVFVARQRNMTVDTGRRILEELEQIPAKVEKVLTQASFFYQLAEKYKDYKNCYFLGRYFNYITAREGALKLKEISYIHAEAYPLGEMKHGPIALIDANFASYVIAPNDTVFKKSLINISEIKARKGRVLAISTDDIEKIVGADDLIRVPKTADYLQNILTTIPTQLIAYYISVLLKCNPDKPRNLAKSVTVG